MSIHKDLRKIGTTCLQYIKKEKQFPRQLLKEKGLDDLTLEGHIEPKIIERNGEQGIWWGGWQDKGN